MTHEIPPTIREGTYKEEMNIEGKKLTDTTMVGVL
jgi:hypothetical protein